MIGRHLNVSLANAASAVSAGPSAARALSSTSSSFFASASSSRATTLPLPVLDLTSLLLNSDHMKKNLVDRRFPFPPSAVDEIVQLEKEAKTLKAELQRLRERRNTLSATSKNGQVAGSNNGEKEEAKLLKSQLKSLEPQLASITSKLDSLSLQLPNTSSSASPIGDETAAITVRTLGPSISSPPPPPNPQLDHLNLSSTPFSPSSTTSSPSSSKRSSLNWFTPTTSSLISGPSWPYLLQEAALLELALSHYALSIAVSHGFSPVITPDVVKTEVSERCGFKPRDGESSQTYYLGTEKGKGGGEVCLVGTAEVPLVAMAAGEVFEKEQLPIRRVAFGRAFRAEAGARGADSRGLYRVHQFTKVEMVVICEGNTDESGRLLQELRSMQEEILGSLGLSLRVLEMPTEELGASAHQKYDIEAWMPGRGKWGELSSASNCTDYQSRRLGIRHRPSSTSKATYCHTLNATAAAIPRLIVALLENGAVLDEQGNLVKVRLPDVLRRFWIGPQEDERIEWSKN